MGRIVLRFLIQLLVVTAPLITLQLSLLDLLGHEKRPDGIIGFGFRGLQLVGTKPEVELKLRLWITVICAVFLVSYEVFEYYIPKRDFKEFRNLYLKEQKDVWRQQIRDDIRINIMHTYRPWWLLFTVRVFQWTWNDGFDPPYRHMDADLFLTEFQGAVGLALRTETPQAVDLRGLPGKNLRFHEKYLLLNQFRLFPTHFKKTERVQYVLSIPIYKAKKGLNETWKAVGVINFDTDTTDGAEFLKKNEGRLCTHFANCGKTIAPLK